MCTVLHTHTRAVQISGQRTPDVPLLLRPLASKVTYGHAFVLSGSLWPNNVECHAVRSDRAAMRDDETMEMGLVLHAPYKLAPVSPAPSLSSAKRLSVGGCIYLPNSTSPILRLQGAPLGSGYLVPHSRHSFTGSSWVIRRHLHPQTCHANGLLLNEVFQLARFPGAIHRGVPSSLGAASSPDAVLCSQTHIEIVDVRRSTDVFYQFPSHPRA